MLLSHVMQFIDLGQVLNCLVLKVGIFIINRFLIVLESAYVEMRIFFISFLFIDYIYNSFEYKILKSIFFFFLIEV